MSDPPIDIPPPVDVQAGPSDGARADVNREAERERVKLEAVILKFNTNYNPLGGPPQGRDLPRLVSPVNRRAGTLPILPPRVNGGSPAQEHGQGGGQAHQPGLLQQLPGLRENVRSLADGGVDRLHINSKHPDANTKESKY